MSSLRVGPPNVYPALIGDVVSSSETLQVFHFYRWDFDSQSFSKSLSSIEIDSSDDHARVFEVWREAINMARFTRRFVAFYQDNGSFQYKRISEFCLWKDDFQLPNLPNYKNFQDWNSVCGKVTDFSINTTAIKVTVKKISMEIPFPDPSKLAQKPQGPPPTIPETVRIYMHVFGVWIAMLNIAFKYNRNLRLVKDPSSNKNVIAVGLNWDDGEP